MYKLAKFIKENEKKKKKISEISKYAFEFNSESFTFR